ncbi:hypothetical protein [Ralstonia mannitolilytica]|uniref:hypothetical protein n=1 Tax=Ralstonia mannitolilytica TaxID=105219 RepID=UPI0014257903|nr:hypothetical protein [Ralstonia mannitolilytica]MBY4717009.1 hypothetical protein [Ralstonia mannitolilytica]
MDTIDSAVNLGVCPSSFETVQRVEGDEGDAAAQKLQATGPALPWVRGFLHGIDLAHAARRFPNPPKEPPCNAKM